MNAQLQHEVRDYLHTKRKQLNKSQTSRYPKASESPQSTGKLQSTESQSQTRFDHVQRVTPGVVRSIFDSSYLRPEENPRVINDTDPAKAHVIDGAEKRY